MRLEHARGPAEVEVLDALTAGDVHHPVAVDELGSHDAELVAQRLEGVRHHPAVVGAPVGVVDVAAQRVRLLDHVQTLGAVLGEDVGDAGSAAHGDDGGDAGAAELLVQFHLLPGHVEQAAHVGVVHAGRRGRVHDGDVPEVLRRIDHGVAAGDDVLHALLLARVDEAAGGLAAAVTGGHFAGLFLVVVADHDLGDLRTQPELLDGPAAHGARAHDGDLHLPLPRLRRRPARLRAYETRGVKYRRLSCGAGSRSTPFWQGW